MGGLTKLDESLDTSLISWDVSPYSRWADVDRILQVYRKEEDTDWELLNVSSKEIKVSTNAVYAYLYKYDTQNIIKDLVKNNILVESIVFVVKKATIF